MSIDFLISHDDKTKIENLCDGSYVLYNRKQDVKDYIGKIIGSSIITGMTKSNEEKNGIVSKEVKFITMTDKPGNIIRFRDNAIAEYTDIMSEMSNKRITDTDLRLEKLIKSHEFDTIKIIIDPYRSDLDDSSFSIDDRVILYHLMQSKYGTIESRDQRVLSDIIDRFISIYGVLSLEQGSQNTNAIIGNKGKKLITNEESIKFMINRKVGNYGKGI